MDKCSQAVDGGGVDGGDGVFPCYSRLFGMDRIEQSARHFRRPGLDVRHAGNKRNAFPHQESPFSETGYKRTCENGPKNELR